MEPDLPLGQELPLEPEVPLELLEKTALRRHFRRLRRQSLAGASPGLRQKALEALPPLLPEGRRLGLYWPVGSEPDLEPLAAAGLAERLPGRLALPAVLPASPLPASPLAAPGRELEGSAALEPAAPGSAMPAGTATRRTQPDGASHADAPALEQTRAGEPERLVYLPWNGEPPSGRDACGIPAPLPALLPAPLPSSLPAPGASPPGGSVALLAPEALGLLLVPALAIDQAGIRLGSGGGWYDRLRADPAWRAVPALAVLPAACVCHRLPRDPWDVPFCGWLDERGVTWLAGAAEGRRGLAGERG